MRTQRHGGRWLRPLLLLVLLLELVGASALLRSELFLREPVEATLNRLGERLGGRLSYESVGPAGLTGVRVQGLRFHPDVTSGLPAMRIDTVRIHPRWTSVFTGRLALERLEVARLEAAIDQDLVERLRAAWDAKREPANSGQGGVWSGWRTLLPDTVAIERVELDVRHPRLNRPHIRVTLADTAIERVHDGDSEALSLRGAFNIPGWTNGRVQAVWSTRATPRLRVAFDRRVDWTELIDSPLTESASVTLRTVEWRWPAELVLERLEADELNAELPHVDRWRVDSLAAERVRVSSSGGGIDIGLESARVGMSSLGDATTLELLSGDMRVDGSGRASAAELVFGRPDSGRMEVAVASSKLLQAVSLRAQAQDYPVDAWAPLFPPASPARLLAGEFTGELSVSLSNQDPVAVMSVRGGLERVVADAPFLAARRLYGFAMGVRGEIRLDRDRHELRWDDGRLSFDGLPVNFEATLAWDQRPRLVVHASLEDLDAEQFRRGLPRGLAPSLEELRLEGSLSATMDLDLDTQRPDQPLVQLDLDLGDVRVVEFGETVPIDRLSADFMLEIPTPDGVGRRIGTLTDEWVTLDEVRRYLVRALTSAEDGRFWQHDGFDWHAIMASVEQNLRSGRIVRGGSTISQQVARTLFLGTERTLGRKFEEAVLTWQLEQLVPKERIMELYVNAVHWGPGIYGIREAARAYFKRTPEALTLRESAFLASILPNPNYFGTLYARDIVTPSRREKICNILQNMRNAGAISERRCERACRQVSRGDISAVPAPGWLLEDGGGEASLEPTALLD